MVRVVRDGARFAQEQQAEIITTRNQRESAFLRLPGDIRNQIYAYAFRDTTIPKFSEMYKSHLDRRLPLPADLRICGSSLSAARSMPRHASYLSSSTLSRFRPRIPWRS
ncbi:hypothetical protein BKA58DRAFT_436646 [Alternaria rosae]|uniref:uncharacterized protein n=1 Tax=Alternaria rosae TaxID=1187941 RepID=UPI001E8CF7C9|nr:uncharacterized protein BKA58DRAFT_436646 [Alternaria rosae]KAH6878962.1 hypothetical protein BKA58DRAFT_436646 [Alternaria rosae]